jgi:hypothetical protein
LWIVRRVTANTAAASAMVMNGLTGFSFAFMQWRTVSTHLTSFL